MATEDRMSARARMIQNFRDSSARQGNWMAQRNALLQRQAARTGIPASGPGSPASFMAQAGEMVRAGNVPPMVQGPNGPQFHPGVNPQAIQQASQDAQDRIMARDAAKFATAPGDDSRNIPGVTLPAAPSLADRARGIQGALGAGPATMAAFAQRPMPVALPAAPVATPAPIPALPPQAAPQTQQAAAPAVPAPSALVDTTPAPATEAEAAKMPPIPPSSPPPSATPKASTPSMAPSPLPAAPLPQNTSGAPPAITPPAPGTIPTPGQGAAPPAQSARLAGAIQAAHQPAGESSSSAPAPGPAAPKAAQQPDETTGTMKQDQQGVQ